jgi:hypothetical protein
MRTAAHRAAVVVAGWASAIVSEEMNRLSSGCSAHQATSESEGCCSMTLLMMLVSRE